jgi:hypothetical protein
MSEQYYLVEEDPAKSLLENFLAKREVIGNRIKEWQKKNMPGKDVYTYSSGNICGFSHDPSEPIPIGWRFDKKNKNMICPKLSCKEGKAIQKEIDELRLPSGEEFTKLMLGEPFAFIGMTLCTAGYELVGDKIIIIAPEYKWKPVGGLKKLKPSEYFALKGE